ALVGRGGGPRRGAARAARCAGGEGGGARGALGAAAARRTAAARRRAARCGVEGGRVEAAAPDVPVVALAFSVDWVDFGTVGLLVVFMVWGSLHGALRQALGLVGLLAAFALASPLGPKLESSVAKVVSLSPAGTACAAWATVWFAVLVAA